MAQDNIFGILSNYNTNDNLPAILDAIRWKETGGEKNPLKAIGSSGEIGAFQLNPKHFHNFGFDVQKNITSGQAQDYWSSRNIASDLLKGMVKYRNYDLGQLLAGYNWGSGDVDKWIAEGGKFEDLPDGTQDYLTKVAQKLQEGYVDPLRAKMKPQPKPNTMMASNDQGINQNYDNFVGDVDKSYMNPHYDFKEIVQEIIGVKPTQAAPPNITNTKIGNNNMSLQDQIAHENLAKGDGSATLFTDPEDGTTYILTGGQDHGIVYDQSKMPQGFQPPNSLNLSNQTLNNPNASGALNIPTSMSAGMDTWENYRDQPEAALTAMNQDMGNRMPGNLTQPSKWSPSAGRDASGQLINNPFGISKAQAATLGNNQSSQSKLPPNPNMTRNNANLSSPSNSMMVSDGEMLMRMAGAGMGSLGKGSSAALGSALDKYGEIKDTNRLTALEIAKAQAEAGADDETLTQIGQLDETMYDMDRALGYLNKYNLTGFFTQYLGTTKDKLFGGKAGNTRQAARKLLEKLRVDDTLLRIAQTKGAISNKEMDLFLSPSPNQGDPEGVWINWIQDRQRALQRVRQRLSTGQTISQGERASSNQVDQFGSGGSNQWAGQWKKVS